MEIRKKITVRKYATAFLNLYFDVFNETMLQPLEEFCNYLKNNRGILCYLSRPGIDQEKQRLIISNLCIRFKLSQFFERLIIVLFEHHHMELLPLIVRKIVQEFLLRARIFTFNVTTSHDIASAQKKKIIAFLIEKMSASKIEATFFVDEKLICGVNIKSDTIMLEHSIRRELKNFEESLLQRVQE